MLNLDHAKIGIQDINPVWTFSHYCNVPTEHFNGSTIKIKSIFKPDEKTPSLCIYFKQDQVKFKCFSTSHSGDHINLVQARFGLNYSESCYKIVRDHRQWLSTGETLTLSDYVPKSTYKVTGFVARNWNSTDRDYFLPFGIGASILEWGNVKPLERYKMFNGTEEIILSGEKLYGYFTKTGSLYKIYQPGNTHTKFMSIKPSYEIGSEHKEGNKFYVILSSWKDAMSFKSLGLSLDIKVPSSENSYFSKEYMKILKKDYKGGFSLLDADDAGKKAMLHYKDKYNLNFIWLPLSKDFSDSIKDHGIQKVRNTVIPLIHKALNH